MKTTKATQAIRMCAIGMMLGVPMYGCTSSTPRTNSSGLSEIDPTLAYSRRQHEEAIEHYTAASRFHADAKYDEALGEYRKALELDNTLYAAWNNMGQLLMAQGDYADAVSAYKIASGIELSDPRPEYNIGLVYQKVGWANDSYAHFKNAIERDPNYSPALRGLIRSAEMLGKGDTQILEYIRTAQLRETDEQWIAYLSTQYYRVEAYIATKKLN